MQNFFKNNTIIKESGADTTSLSTATIQLPDKIIQIGTSNKINFNIILQLVE